MKVPFSDIQTAVEHPVCYTVKMECRNNFHSEIVILKESFFIMCHNSISGIEMEFKSHSVQLNGTQCCSLSGWLMARIRASSALSDSLFSVGSAAEGRCRCRLYEYSDLCFVSLSRQQDTLRGNTNIWLTRATVQQMTQWLNFPAHIQVPVITVQKLTTA